MNPLPVEFFDRDPARVARELIGCILVRSAPEGVAAGRIVETEAYLAQGDPGSHSFEKRTRKNASMFGPPGRAYVYPIHAKWCFNAVTEPEGAASAVLIRAVEPTEGVPLMQARRGRYDLLDLARGPARLCQAFAIDRALDGFDLTRGETLFIAADPDPPRPTPSIARSPRIGLSRGADLPLRFFLEDCRFVSGPRRPNAR
jgi:DNA-3-methyladenine glycosylase